MPIAQAKGKKHIFLLLRIAVVLGGVILAIIWLSRRDRWVNLKEIFSRMNIWVFAAALGIFVIGQIIIALRWWLLLRTQSIFISFWAAVRLYLLGWFYNNVMPSSVGGDLIRLWYVTKHTDKKFEAALSVIVDRAIGLASTLVIAVFFYLLFLRSHGRKITLTAQDGCFSSLTKYKWIFLCVLMGAAAVLAALLMHPKGRLLLKKTCSRLLERGAAIIRKLAASFALYRSKPLVLLAAFALTVGLQIATITGFWFLGVNLGITASIKYYYVFFTLTWVLGAVPVSIGGAVVVEGLLAALFVKFAGVEQEPAFALALCQRFVWLLASVPGAVIHLIGAHLPPDQNCDKIVPPGPKDFFVDSDMSIK